MSPGPGVSYPQWALIGALGWLGYQLWLLSGGRGKAATPEEASSLLVGVGGAAIVVLVAVGFVVYSKRGR